ncbi:hypothetical protein PoB_000167000 [Plakobranchus ocellatus]|uniref:Uncharacterized protein n=1 Tax=Plakobranchus ocellatus TaxID=259542 RepID=A0AAV3XX05_9GAST|nr:hypothetical protein PoB_000167000 [Plakobranchus ocellatus]
MVNLYFDSIRDFLPSPVPPSLPHKHHAKKHTLAHAQSLQFTHNYSSQRHSLNSHTHKRIFLVSGHLHGPPQEKHDQRAELRIIYMMMYTIYPHIMLSLLRGHTLLEAAQQQSCLGGSEEQSLDAQVMSGTISGNTPKGMPGNMPGNLPKNTP